MEKVQRRAVKMITGLKATSYEEKLKELGINSGGKKKVPGHATDL